MRRARGNGLAAEDYGSECRHVFGESWEAWGEEGGVSSISIIDGYLSDFAAGSGSDCGDAGLFVVGGEHFAVGYSVCAAISEIGKDVVGQMLNLKIHWTNLTDG